MAQTREHLAILQLTGNPQLTVALTKADRVDDARVSEARNGAGDLREYGFADAPLLSPWRQKGAVSTNFATICSSFHHASTPAITAFVWRSTGRLPSKARGWW
jgi:hypothetical protein